MTKQILIFAATFLLGAIIALAARTATHTSHEHSEPTQNSKPKTQNQVATAPPTPNPKPQTPNSSSSLASSELQTQNSKPKTQNPDSAAPVNTLCAICGMKVDPKLPTLEYKGKQIGFGCRMCPPKFKADPDKYGPYYLRNELMPK